VASVTIVFRTDKTNIKGESPVYFRIIKSRKTSYIYSGYKVHYNLWDFDKNKVKTNHPNSSRLNAYLLNKCSELIDNVLELEKNNKSLTSKILKEKIYGKENVEFFTFAENIIQQYYNKGKISTFDSRTAIMNKLKVFVKNKKLYFNDITVEFLAAYENYLRSKLNNGTNTVHCNMKFFRKLFNDAVRLNIIERYNDPFLRYKLELEKTTRNYLTEHELELFENVDVSESKRLSVAQDMFIFSSYTGGLRVSDVLQLRWKNYTGTHINFTIKKTGQQLSIKIPLKSISIIEKYKPGKTINPNHFIFPVFDNNLEVDNPIALDLAISRGTALINGGLRIIAKRAEINKKVSFHVSRHSFATRALLKGISIDKVSKLMGHAQIRETQIYAKIVSEELDKAMDVFN
jgi:integrase/recombinase XerD